MLDVVLTALSLSVILAGMMGMGYLSASLLNKYIDWSERD